MEKHKSFNYCIIVYHHHHHHHHLTLELLT